MWDYSESDADDKMACRCSYCGKFCSRANIHQRTGLCLPCKEKLRPSEAEAESEAERAETNEMTDDNGSESGESLDSEAEGKEEASQEPESRLKGLGESDQPAKSNLCARCWSRQPTRVLYNSPTCDECYQVAKAKKEGSRGTKVSQILEFASKSNPNRYANTYQRRFQPTTPLQPGKKLTRVCDSCRQKRKRCEHRRVVDADDPDVADRRRKRIRVEAPIPEEDESEGSSPTLETRDKGIVSNSSTGPNVEEPAASNCGSAEENLQWAIKQSIQTVYRREMERLVQVADSKMEEATEAFDAVKRHMNSWLFELSKKRVNGS
ncbi:hypothetical protein PRK78_003189 [Emydomyces testavorans]|uniref:Uncharacterized protein n=1 Tax=Emydomyces testavorans TaxID=2070801 RepID=A0AAF0DFR4_9EURO|nr:hypothetical protein PRK78_003189 [Emydomyces testavorans]